MPAAGSFKTSRKRVRNGGRVMFRGRVASVPLPAVGQAGRDPGQAADRGVDHLPHPAQRRPRPVGAALPLPQDVRCHTRYRLRAHIPAEAGYPFAAGHSRARSVLVRGAERTLPMTTATEQAGASRRDSSPPGGLAR